MYRDSDLLGRLADEDPVDTLVRLDGMIRGACDVVDGYTVADLTPPDAAKLRGWIEWLVDRDLDLRRHAALSQREADIRILRALYRNRNLALVAGAGVSMAAGMPDWRRLVIEMIDRALDRGSPEHREATAKHVLAASSGDFVSVPRHGRPRLVKRSLLEAALAEELKPADSASRAQLERAREELRGSRPIRSQALRDATQATHEVFGDEFAHQLGSVLFSRTLYRTALHPAIARMVHPQGRNETTSTPGFRIILTYNFDDLRETAIRESGHEYTVHLSRSGVPGELRLGSPFGDSTRPQAVDIFHVHGFTPAPAGAYAFADLDEVDLVFSETQYTETYGEDSSWTTQTQSVLFGRFPCLFIGSSLEDDETDAQLTAAHRRRPVVFHYAILKSPVAAGHRGGPPPRPEDLERHAEPYRGMGLRVLWVHDYDSGIPDLLARISDDDSGSAVEDELDSDLPIGVVLLPDTRANAVQLGIILAQREDWVGAQHEFNRALGCEDARVAAQAARNLGVLRLDQQDVAGAIHAFEAAVDCDDPESSPRAGVDLGRLLLAVGQPERGAAVLRAVVRTGHRVWAAAARRDLVDLDRDPDEPDRNGPVRPEADRQQ